MSAVKGYDAGIVVVVVVVGPTGRVVVVVVVVVLVVVVVVLSARSWFAVLSGAVAGAGGTGYECAVWVYRWLSAGVMAEEAKPTTWFTISCRSTAAARAVRTRTLSVTGLAVANSSWRRVDEVLTSLVAVGSFDVASKNAGE